MSPRAQYALLLAPAVVGAVALVPLPAVVTLITALFETDLLGPAAFAGLANFRELLSDPVFAESLRNSLAFAALTVPVRLLAAIGLALMLHRPRRGAGALRTAAYLPTVVPEVATVIAWTFLLNPVYGPVNGVLGALGLGEGFVIALAARQEQPAELYDLARMEGSSRLHVLRRVTLPADGPGARAAGRP